MSDFVEAYRCAEERRIRNRPTQITFVHSSLASKDVLGIPPSLVNPEPEEIPELVPFLQDKEWERAPVKEIPPPPKRKGRPKDSERAKEIKKLMRRKQWNLPEIYPESPGGGLVDLYLAGEPEPEEEPDWDAISRAYEEDR